MGLSVMTHAGLGEFATSSREQWVQAVEHIVGDVSGLAILRQQMRDRLMSSPLMDAASLARHIEAEYRRMWRGYCESSNVR
jgi:predicted O-linked N-acetylglucosamine transferase (SPINDLY family)